MATNPDTSNIGLMILLEKVNSIFRTKLKPTDVKITLPSKNTGILPARNTSVTLEHSIFGSNRGTRLINYDRVHLDSLVPIVITKGTATKFSDLLGQINQKYKLLLSIHDIIDREITDIPDGESTVSIPISPNSYIFYDGAVIYTSPRPKIEYEADSVISHICKGVDKYLKLSDGKGGYYFILDELNSIDCGYGMTTLSTTTTPTTTSTTTLSTTTTPTTTVSPTPTVTVTETPSTTVTPSTTETTTTPITTVTPTPTVTVTETPTTTSTPTPSPVIDNAIDLGLIWEPLTLGGAKVVGIIYNNNTWIIISLDGTITTTTDLVTLNTITTLKDKMADIGANDPLAGDLYPDVITYNTFTVIDGIYFVSGNSGWLYTSTDLITWNAVNAYGMYNSIADNGPVAGVIKIGTEYVAFPTYWQMYGSVAFINSTDGITWNTCGNSIKQQTGGYSVRRITKIGNYYYCYLNDVNYLFRSSDGLTWTEIGSSQIANPILSLASSGTRLVAILNTYYETAISDDFGDTWTINTNLNTMNWLFQYDRDATKLFNIVYVGDRFIVLGGTDGIIYCATSTDGLTWTKNAQTGSLAVIYPDYISWDGSNVTYGNNKVLLFAGKNKVAVSPGIVVTTTAPTTTVTTTPTTTPTTTLSTTTTTTTPSTTPVPTTSLSTTPTPTTTVTPSTTETTTTTTPSTTPVPTTTVTTTTTTPSTTPAPTAFSLPNAVVTDIADADTPNVGNVWTPTINIIASGYITGVIHDGTQWVMVTLGAEIITTTDFITFNTSNSLLDAMNNDTFMQSNFGDIVDIGRKVSPISYINGKYIVISDYCLIFVSTDLINWTVATSLYSDYNWEGNSIECLFLTSLQEYVVVSQSGGLTAKSTNGTTWTNYTSQIKTHFTNVTLKGLKRLGNYYYAWSEDFGADGNVLVARSADGITWTRLTGLISCLNDGLEAQFGIKDITYDGTKLVAILKQAHYLLISTDNGVTWSFNNGLRSLTWSGGIESWTKLETIIWTGTKFIGIGKYGAEITSPDGVTWTSQPSLNEMVASPLFFYDTGANRYELYWANRKLIAASSKKYLAISPYITAPATTTSTTTPPTTTPTPSTWWTTVAGLTPLAIHDANNVTGAQLLDRIGSNHITASSTFNVTTSTYKRVAGNGAVMDYASPVAVPSDCTFAALVSETGHTILFYDTSSGGWAYYHDNNLNWYTATGQNTYHIYGTTSLASDFRFVAVVATSDTTTMYIDGVELGSTASHMVPPNINKLGYPQGSLYNLNSNEYISALGIWSGAATQEQLVALEAACRLALTN